MDRIHERIDDLHRNNYKIIQNPDLFCFGQDAVLLAEFAKAIKKERVLDLCSGNAIIPILMCARNKGTHFEAIEIQKQCVDLAKRSIELNGLSDRINIIECDLKEAAKFYELSSFDVVTVNPPYMNGKSGLVNDFLPKAIARHELLCNLDDVVCTAAKMLKFGGRFYMIHRPNRLCDIFNTMRKYKIEPKLMRMVSPKLGKSPTMVLIEGKQGGSSFLKVMPELIIYDENSNYTQEVRSIYYD